MRREAGVEDAVGGIGVGIDHGGVEALLAGVGDVVDADGAIGAGVDGGIEVERLVVGVSKIDLEGMKVLVGTEGHLRGAGIQMDGERGLRRQWAAGGMAGVAVEMDLAGGDVEGGGLSVVLC